MKRKAVADIKQEPERTAPPPGWYTDGKHEGRVITDMVLGRPSWLLDSIELRK